MINLGIPESVFRLPENVEEMSLEELQEYSHSIGMYRQRMRNVQLEIRKIMESRGQRFDEPQKLFVMGTASKKAVGTPGG